MSQLALYRAWRPQSFDEVVAQKQVVFPLKQAVISGDLGHAYLFAGTRGTGKTSMAKIFAKAVNCLNPQDGNPCNECAICQGINSGALLDVMEMDAASHNSVDNIRRLTDEVMFMPAEARYKVYIIDEVHMLSQGAFNALLKTLEEPPAHVIFILATTEVQRIPATILSRCQRFEFRRIPLEDIAQRLQDIAQADHIDITDQAINMIARLGDGALRDAISLLDQAQAGIKGQITEASVLDLAGLVQDDFLADFALQVFQGDLPGTLAAIEELQMSGRDLQRFVQDFLRYLRDILVMSLGGDSHKLLTQSPEGLRRLQQLAGLSTREEIMAMLGRLSQLNSDLRWSTDPRTSVELAFISEVARREAGGPSRPATEPAEIVTAPAAELQRPLPPAPAQDSAPMPTAGPAYKQAPTQAPALTPIPEPTSDSNPEPISDTNPTPTPIPEPTPDPDQEPIFDSNPAPTPAESGARVGEEAEETEPALRSWNLVLDALRDRDCYSLILLLRPAHVSWEGEQVRIQYEETYKAHAAALQKVENKEELMQAIYAVSQAQGLGLPQLQIEIAGEELSDSPNLNPAEPVWVQKLRKVSAQFQLPFDPADVMEEPSPGPSDLPPDQVFYQFPETEDRLPY